MREAGSISSSFWAIAASVAPLRDGQLGGLLLELTLPNGTKMLPGVPNAARYKITS